MTEDEQAVFDVIRYRVGSAGDALLGDLRSMDRSTLLRALGMEQIEAIFGDHAEGVCWIDGQEPSVNERNDSEA